MNSEVQATGELPVMWAVLVVRCRLVQGIVVGQDLTAEALLEALGILNTGKTQLAGLAAKGHAAFGQIKSLRGIDHTPVNKLACQHGGVR